MTVPYPKWGAAVAVIAGGAHFEADFKLDFDQSLKKPRVRVRAPSERISMDDYFLLCSQWTAAELEIMRPNQDMWSSLNLNRILDAPVS
jgi:hypothetical protein